MPRHRVLRYREVVTRVIIRCIRYRALAVTTERAISRHDALIRVCRYAPPHRLMRIIRWFDRKRGSHRRGVGEIGVIREMSARESVGRV